MNRNEPGSAPTSPQKKKRRWLWTVVFILITALSVWTITSQIKSFSLQDFVAYITGASPLWLLLAFAAMLGFIIFEGLALRCTCRAFGSSCRVSNSYFYSSADIYFSAITPSASGGQPASAFFMITDGIPAPLTAVALLLNLIMYAVSIVAVGVIGFILRPGVFLGLRTLSKVLILGGCVAQAVLIAFFLVLLKKAALAYKIGEALIRILSKIRLIRRKEEKMERLRSLIDEYQHTSDMISGKTGLLVKLFFLNLGQRVSQIAVTLFVFLAGGGEAGLSADIYTTQVMTVLGSNYIPIPGAVGVSDFLMLDGFGTLMPEQAAVNLELFSRSLSFYFCVLVCGISVIVKYWMLRRQRRKSL